MKQVSRRDFIKTGSLAAAGISMAKDRIFPGKDQERTVKVGVIGTGNRDEDYGVGYYTLFGGGAVHLSPIGNLPKRMVREMAAYLGFDDLAERVSTAGLEPGQTCFKDLGCDLLTHGKTLPGCLIDI